VACACSVDVRVRYIREDVIVNNKYTESLRCLDSLWKHPSKAKHHEEWALPGHSPQKHPP